MNNLKKKLVTVLIVLYHTVRLNGKMQKQKNYSRCIKNENNLISNRESRLWSVKYIGIFFLPVKQNKGCTKIDTCFMSSAIKTKITVFIYCTVYLGLPVCGWDEPGCSCGWGCRRVDHGQLCRVSMKGVLSPTIRYLPQFTRPWPYVYMTYTVVFALFFVNFTVLRAKSVPNLFGGYAN